MEINLWGCATWLKYLHPLRGRMMHLSLYIRVYVFILLSEVLGPWKHENFAWLIFANRCCPWGYFGVL